MLSVLSNYFIFACSLNIITLSHFLMLPAFVCQFFIPAAYLFMFNVERKQLVPKSKLAKRLNSATKLPNRIVDLPVENTKYKQLKFAYKEMVSQSSGYLIGTVILNFLFMSHCTTYYFWTLFVFIMSTAFNLFLHLYLF